MLAVVLAIAALSNTILPAVTETAGAVISAADLAGPKITNVIEITEVTAIDQGTVEVWAKNVGSRPVVSPASLIVQVGPETNMPHIPYGGIGCAAPCWGYALQHGDTWERGATIDVRVYLVDALLPDTRYFAALQGIAGGQARREFRIGDQVPTRTPTPTPTITPTPTPTP